MRLKSFQASTMQDALKQVKETLGDDAIIVSTREEAGGWVRITAAVEQIIEKPAQKTTADPAFDDEEIAGMITDILLKHRVPASVGEKIISNAMIVSSGDPQKTLARALEKTFVFNIPQDTPRKPVMLVGPPGAGKTLMTAKLAAQAVLNGEKPTIITTDIARAGGVEQLSAFINIMKLPLLQAEDARTLQQAMAQADNPAHIIIDTGGLNPFDPQEMKFLARLIAVADIVPSLVLPAGIDAEESAEMAQTFEILGVKKIIPTRLDFARRIGGILSAADKAGFHLGEASHTPQVANGITFLTPQKLAEMLLPQTSVESAQEKGKRGRR